MNKLFKSLAVGLFLLLSFTAIQARTVNVVDFGAIPDDDIDDSRNLIDAVQDLINGGGGTLVFPSGTIDLEREISFAPGVMMNFRMVGDKGSTIRLNGEESTNFFVVERAIRFEVENLNFIYTGESKLNAATVIWVREATSTRIKGSSFFGIGASEAVVQLENTNASIIDTVFCGVGSKRDVLRAINSKGLSISKVEFRKTGSFLGVDYDKGESLATAQWVSVTNNPEGNNPMGNGTVTIRDSFFDSGVVSGVKAENQKTLEVSGSTFFVSQPVTSSAVSLDNVPYASIVSCSFTGVDAGLYAINAGNASYVDVTALNLNNISVIRLYSGSNWHITYCPQCLPYCPQCTPALHKTKK